MRRCFKYPDKILISWLIEEYFHQKKKGEKEGEYVELLLFTGGKQKSDKAAAMVLHSVSSLRV